MPVAKDKNFWCLLDAVVIKSEEGVWQSHYDPECSDDCEHSLYSTYNGAAAVAIPKKVAPMRMRPIMTQWQLVKMTGCCTYTHISHHLHFTVRPKTEVKSRREGKDLRGNLANSNFR